MFVGRAGAPGKEYQDVAFPERGCDHAALEGSEFVEAIEEQGVVPGLVSSTAAARLIRSTSS